MAIDFIGIIFLSNFNVFFMLFERQHIIYKEKQHLKWTCNINCNFLFHIFYVDLITQIFIYHKIMLIWTHICWRMLLKCKAAFHKELYLEINSLFFLWNKKNRSLFFMIFIDLCFGIACEHNQEQNQKYVI